MRCLSVATFAMMACSALALDAKSDCIDALNAANAAGLPTSPADLKVVPPSKATLELEKLLERAAKTMRKFEPDIGVIVDIDMANLKRKEKGQKELPHPEVTPAQKAIRTKELFAIIEQIGATTASRLSNARSTPIDIFPRAASVKALVNLQLDDAASVANGSDAKEVVRKLRIVRRLIALVRSDATVVGMLSEQASEQKYYAYLQRIAKENPVVGKAFTFELVAPLPKPTVEQILREEFIHMLAPFEVTSNTPKGQPFIPVGNWKLEAGKVSLELMTLQVRAFTTVFSALRTAKNGQEIEDRYKVLAPKLGTYKFSDGEEMELGAAWAANARALDRAEAKRLETVKILGLG